MATKATSNTFKKFDTDTSQNKQDNSSFYDAENLRLITDEALSNGALVNFKGTKAKLNLGKEVQLKGYAEVGDTLGLLLHQKESVSTEAATPAYPSPMNVNNFTTAATSYSNITNTLIVQSAGSQTVTGPSSSNLEVGQLIMIEGVPVPEPLIFLPGYTYKVSYNQSSMGGYFNIPYSVIVGGAAIQGIIDSSKATSSIPEASVLQVFNNISKVDEANQIEFTVPNDYVGDLFVAFYPTQMVLDVDSYNANIVDNSMSFSNISIEYKENTTYTDITSTSLEQPVLPEVVSLGEVIISEDFSTDGEYTYVDITMSLSNTLDNSGNPVEYTLGLSEYHPTNGYIGPVAAESITCYSDDTINGEAVVGEYIITNPGTSEAIHARFKYLSSAIPDFKLFTLILSSGNNSAALGTTVNSVSVEQVTAGTDYIPLDVNISYTSTLKYNVTFIASTFVTTYNLIPGTNGGLIKGSKYILPISFTSPTATTTTVQIFGQDGVVHQTFTLSAETTTFNFVIDLTNVFNANAYTIRLLAGIDKTITYTYGIINRIITLNEFYTIPDSAPYVTYVKAVNVIGGPAVPYVTLHIIHPTTKAVAKSFSIPTTDSDTVLKYEGYSGYKIAINTSPYIVAANAVNITNFLVHKIATEETNIASLTTNFYYEFTVGAEEDPTYNCVGKTIQVIIKNTSVIPAVVVKSIEVPIQDPTVTPLVLKYFVPNDGAGYVLAVRTTSPTNDILAGRLTGMIIKKFNINPARSIIAKAVVGADNTVQNIVQLYSDANSATKLGFLDVSYIEAVGRYDSDYVKNIYFAVPGHPVRSFNLAPTPLTPSLAEATTLDLLPNVEGSIVSVEGVLDGGNLESGKIQYSCRLFNKYGNESTFSATSKLIALTTSSVSGSVEFKGSDLEVSSGKSVQVSVDLSNNTTFDYIKIYSIHYKEKDVPVISLVAELPIGNQSIVSFIDNGTVLNTVTLEEFNIFGGRLISAETLATKNNILFAGNISETIETISESDLDCRSYRFDNTGTAEIFENDDLTHPTKYVVDSTGETAVGIWNGSSYSYTVLGSNYNVPIDADCINKYNDEFLVPNEGATHPYPYMYQSDGTTLGGSGKIVDYQIKIEDSYTKLVDNGETVITSDNINYILKSTSFKQGETYRIGITFFDLKGKPFFNRWIGDVRMPYMDLFISHYNQDTPNLEMSLRNMYLEVTVKTINIPQAIKDKISGFQITKVERTLNDRSVVAQGYTTGGITYDLTTNKYLSRCLPVDKNFVPHANMDAYKANYQYMTNFISPEFNINNGIDADGTYRLKVVKILANPVLRVRVPAVAGSETGWLNNGFHNTTSFGITAATKIAYPLTKVTSSSVEISQELSALTGKAIVPNYSFDINTIKRVYKEELGGGGVMVLPNSTPVSFINRVASDSLYSDRLGGSTHTMYGQTGAIISSDTAIPYNSDFTNSYNPSGVEYTFIYLFDLYKNTALSRYGGNTYINRTLNQYHSISEFTLLDSPTVNAYGDTYNTVFDTLTSINDGNVEDAQADDTYYAADCDRRQLVYMLPIESSINTMLMSNKASKWVYNHPSGRNLDSKYVGLMEKAVDGANMYGDRYPDVGDFNRYNTAYSAINKYPVFVQEPLLFQEIKQQPYTILASELSISGDLVDNWTKFLTANFIDLDSAHGTIHKLTAFDNKLYFVQEDAVGIVAVKDRYILTEGVTQLALGTGGVLERYDYLKYNTGILHPSHAINITSGLYYVDIARSVINTLREADVSMSLEKGINSLVRKLLTSTSTIVLGYDVKYNELYITVLNTGTSKTLVYNEILGQFTPNISYKPTMWLSLKDGAYSFIQSIVGVNSYIYRHNVGQYNEIYTEAQLPISGYTESYVSVLVNPNSNIVNVYDAVDFRTEVLDSTSDIFNDSNTYDTVDKIEFKNSYQTVSKDIIVKDGVNSKPNASRRFRSWTTQVPLTTTSKRFLDTFLSLTFRYFGNSGNKIFKLHDIITYYREYHK